MKRLIPGLLAAIAVAGCAPSSSIRAPAGDPVPDPGGTAAALADATAPTERRQVSFAWALDEQGSRVSGRGVVRLQPPDRLRLDLFGPRNESYLSAAMVGDEVRLPGGLTTADVPIPSPALLWAGLGVIHPPRGAELAAATRGPEGTVLRYTAPSGESFEYIVTPEPSPRLRQLERSGSRGALETVRLEWGDTGEIQRSHYRDWSAYRDLTLTVERSVAAEPFPEAIWRP